MNRLSTSLMLFLFTICLSYDGSTAGASERKVVLIELQHADASTIAPSVRVALSATGKMSVSVAANSLIVNDYQANIRAIRSLVAKLDITPANIHISVRFVDRRQAEEITGRLRFRTMGGGWSVSSVPALSNAATGVGVDLSAAIKNMRAEKTQTLRLLENTIGTIFVGESFPVEQVERYIGPRGQIITSSGTTFHRAGTSFTVSARRAGKGKLAVSISPVSSTRRPDGSVALQEVGTTVVVNDPGTLVIGGEQGNMDESSANFPPGANRNSSQQRLTIILSVRSE